MIRPRTRVLTALIAKDFRIHGRDILLTHAGILGLLAVMDYLQPGEQAGIASAAFNFNFLLAGFWSEWLISREKVKGTFAWLRASPVSDAELVLAKFLAVGICCVSLWIASSLIFARDYFWQQIEIWIVLQLSLLMFGGLAVGTRWRFGQKLGQMLPYVIVGVVIGILIFAARSGRALPLDPEVLLRHPSGQAVMAAGFAAGAVAAFYATLTWVRGSDTANLLE